MSNGTMTINGPPQRKQLSAQLDRLDAILDGLSEALDESVADAVRGAVGRAVKEAVEATLREVLAGPGMPRAALAAQEPPAGAEAGPARPPALSRPPLVRAAARTACAGTLATARGAAKTLGSACSRALRRCRRQMNEAAAAGAGACRAAWRFRAHCAAAAAAGVAAGFGSYLAGPMLASVACGLAGSALTAAGAVAWPFFRLPRGAASA